MIELKHPEYFEGTLQLRNINYKRDVNEIKKSFRTSNNNYNSDNGGKTF